MLKFHLVRIWENEVKLPSFVHYFLIFKGLSVLFSHLIHICADICLTLVLRVPHGSTGTCTSAVSGGNGTGKQPLTRPILFGFLLSLIEKLQHTEVK